MARTTLTITTTFEDGTTETRTRFSMINTAKYIRDTAAWHLGSFDPRNPIKVTVEDPNGWTFTAEKA